MASSTLPKLLFFCTFLLYGTTGRDRISLSDIDKPGQKMNECQRCKILTDSFNHWLDKTSRGKFEGGDAAWEEAKLKSYARSEIRLVEIQEGLCSELKKQQDDCYALAEEAEHVLEKWWFQEDPNSVDLYTWLCIETLKHCCPKNHFGEFCTPCPIDNNNNICSGNGICDGEGTRRGNGTCICKKGYTGKHCNECANNYYSVSLGVCKPCHKACVGCTGAGASACVACKSGWSLESGTCKDVDECSNPATCTSDQYCTNNEGSYTCKKCDKSCKTCHGAGSTNCTSCDSNDVLWSGSCVSETLKIDILKDAFKRTALYCGLLIIIYFILRKSKSLASLVVVIVSFYIYLSEKTSTMNVLEVFSNMYSHLT